VRFVADYEYQANDTYSDECEQAERQAAFHLSRRLSLTSLKP
jgi:hypothetical protein